MSSQALFHIRGNSSRAFSKHSYRIKLVEDANPEQNRDLPLLGMTANADWALHGPFLDKTQLRNYMWMNISAEVMGYAPNVRFCELILDGEYQGLYLLMETVSMDSGRVELTDYREGDPDVYKRQVPVRPRSRAPSLYHKPLSFKGFFVF